MTKNYYYRLIDYLFTKRQWSSEDIAKYAGHYHSSYMLYSTSADTRSLASSGGVVSEILIYCMEKGIINGALVCRTKVIDGKARPVFFIAKNQREILSARGSKYIKTRFVSEAIPLIDQFNGKLAVVGLPCDLKILTHKMEKSDSLKNKIYLKIGLFCGHNSETKLIDNITNQLEAEVESRLVDFKFRIGLWRGNIRASFQNGVIVHKKTNLFTDYQNLYFFAQKKCFYCNDHFAYFADISAGDIWSYYLKNKSYKYTSLIFRNTLCAEIIQSMLQNDRLRGKSIDIKEILDGQSRGIKLHHNIYLKSKIGKFFGIKIPLSEQYREKFKWHEFIVACIVFFNWRWSRSQWSHLIFKIPRPVLKLYLYLVKGLQSL
ncbi:MAG: Coenzyme F420 hydrogenase/dehydrogenase, beta subunit C-terminal domain [bacterium]